MTMNAWGSAWGGYQNWLGTWGTSWGPLHEVEEKRGGGIGHGKEGKKQKRVVVEQDGKLLLFRNARDAALFVQLQKKPELKKVRKQKNLPIVQPLDEIDLSVVEKYQEKLEEYIPEFTQEKLEVLDIGILLKLAEKLREWEEDDIEILLLAA